MTPIEIWKYAKVYNCRNLSKSE